MNDTPALVIDAADCQGTLSLALVRLERHAGRWRAILELSCEATDETGRHFVAKCTVTVPAVQRGKYLAVRKRVGVPAVEDTP